MSKKSTTDNIEAIAKKYSLTELKLNPADLVVVTNPKHPLFQERALWPVDEQLVSDIKADGFSSVVLVGEEWLPEIPEVPADAVFDGYVVIAGRQRTKAAVAAGVAEIPVLNIGPTHLIPISELQALMVKENERRINNNAFEKAVEMQRLYNTRLQELKPIDWPSELEWKPKLEKSEALKFVCAVFGLSDSSVRNALKLLDEDVTSKELLVAIKKGKLAFDAATKFTKFSKEDQAKYISALEPVMAKKEKEAEASGGKSRKAVSKAEASAVIDKNATVKIKRAELEKTRARRSCPPDVKDYIKHLLNPGSVDLPYLPGRLEKLDTSSEA